MNWIKKIKKQSYEESLELLISMCNMHQLCLYKHTDNYIGAKFICVLSIHHIHIGQTYYELEQTTTEKNLWYLSPKDYQKFLNI